MVKSKRADACYEVTKKVLQALGANVASSEYTQGFGYMGQPPYGGRDLTGCAPLAPLQLLPITPTSNQGLATVS
jgi:hypothetical protein